MNICGLTTVVYTITGWVGKYIYIYRERERETERKRWFTGYDACGGWDRR